MKAGPVGVGALAGEESIMAEVRVVVKLGEGDVAVVLIATALTITVFVVVCAVSMLVTVVVVTVNSERVSTIG